MDLGVVIVIYNSIYSQTKSYQSLEKCAKDCKEVKFHVIVYDNSQNSQNIENDYLFDSLVYYHDERNLGVIPAYRYAIDYCKNHGILWLLRLDQDSTFDGKLIVSFLGTIDNASEHYSAVIPKIKCGNRFISPSIIRRGGLYFQIQEQVVGIPDKRITFINSMSFINVEDKAVTDAIRRSKYMLDLSDHDVAYSLKPQNIFILKDVVNHSLSVAESSYVSLERYKKILTNEIDFVNKREGIRGRMVLSGRLIIRSLKFLLSGMVSHARVTIQNIFE